MLKPIKKPPFYTTTIDPVRTKYEIEAMLKTFGAEAVQWTEIYEKQYVEVKFIMEIEVDGKPFKGVFSFKPRPLYMVKTPYRGSRQERKGVINWAATYRLQKNY